MGGKMRPKRGGDKDGTGADTARTIGWGLCRCWRRRTMTLLPGGRALRRTAAVDVQTALGNSAPQPSPFVVLAFG